MTKEELLNREKDYSETKIQHTCVSWFRQTFPSAGNLLFAIPNGGIRTVKSGAMRKYEGAISGVADLILLYPQFGKGSLCIEMKVPKVKGKPVGKQSESQVEWQKLVEQAGNVYVVCHGLVEFIEAVCDYMRADKDKYIELALDYYDKFL